MYRMMLITRINTLCIIYSCGGDFCQYNSRTATGKNKDPAQEEVD
jgi:hypothetical protein